MRSQPSIRLRGGAAWPPLMLVLLSGLGCGDPATGTGPGPAPTRHTLAVEMTGHGQGVVTSQPAGINCSRDGGSCAAEFADGTTVALVAAPSEGHVFEEWAGACAGAGGCSVTLRADRSVAAAFDDPRLTVEAVGAGGGTVTSRDGGLSLVFPAGALPATREITVREIDAGSLGQEWAEVIAQVGVAQAWELGPPGLAFGAPVRVRIEMDADEADGEEIEMAAGTLLVSDGSSIEPLEEFRARLDADTRALVLEADLEHFSMLVATDITWSFSVSGVPPVAVVDRFWTIRATAESRFLDFSSGRYLDASLAPVDADFHSPQNMSELGLSFFRFVGRYRCTESGTGTFEAAARVAPAKQPGAEGAPPVLELMVRGGVACVAPPSIQRLAASLAVPVTTYTIDATDPAGGELSYEWKMMALAGHEHEQCGTPQVPWTQTGRVVSWSHSSDAPDLCPHEGLDHAVFLTVRITSGASGIAVVCVMTGTLTRVIDNPNCALLEEGARPVEREGPRQVPRDPRPQR
jgi:hypothetical protein